MSDRATSGRSGALSDFVAALGDWSGAGGPLFRRLARAVAAAIERGALPQGSRLPSERTAAAVLSVGRGTAVAAYDVLVAEGLIERRHGSGTYVQVSDQPPMPAGREGSALVLRLVERSDPGSDVLDLSLSVLHDAAGLPQVSVDTTDLMAVVPDTGYTPWGLPELRRALAKHITGWGLPTAEEQVIVTTGAQQAISAAAACWVRPGDTVVVDDPTYPGALACFVQAGARILPVPVDAEGVVPDALADALAQRPALVYLQSGVHSPTGTVLPDHRRRAVAATLAASHVPVVEDAALADLAWGPLPPPLASYAPEASVAVVGSLSKLFWGGLRVGFVRAPEPLALRFARIKATQDLGSSAVGQVLAQRLLASGPPELIRQERSAELRSRYEVLGAALRRHLGQWTWSEPAGGMSVWVDTGAPAEAFAQHALRHGVAVATPGALSPTGHHDHRIRLSYSAPAEQLEAAVERLAVAHRAWRSGPG